MAVAWPTVKARLVEVLPTLPALASSTFYDGPNSSGDAAGTWVAIGWQPSTADDPSSPSPFSAGSYEQTPGPSGFAASETGSVLLEVGGSTGDTVVPDVFALADAITTWVQSDQTLGVLSANATAVTAVEVTEAQTAAGAAQRLLMSLNYTTWL